MNFISHWWSLNSITIHLHAQAKKHMGWLSFFHSPHSVLLSVPGTHIAHFQWPVFVLGIPCLKCWSLDFPLPDSCHSNVSLMSPPREAFYKQLILSSSSILAWRIQWTGEPGGLQTVGSQGVRHDWRDLACIVRNARFCTYCFMWLTQAWGTELLVLVYQ